MKRDNMTDDELVSHIELLEWQTNANQATPTAQQQALAMQYYLGLPFGTEEEGRSRVISSDVWDVVEGITPLILKPFVSSDDVVRFNPEGPDDEAQAEQESDYINYVVTTKNDVFETLINWVKTGLLQKNGVVKYWWETSTRKKIERYTGLTDDVYTALIQDDNVQVVEHTEHPPVSGVPFTPGDPATQPMMQDPQATLPTHDVVIRVSHKYGEAKFAVVPPEEFRISRNATSANPKKAQFVQHVTRKTISEIREMGYDVEDDISDSGTQDPRYMPQFVARHSDDTDQMPPIDAADATTRTVIYRETYLYVDADGDGIAELRKVVIVGRDVLLNEETEEIPFCGWTPYPQPFRFDGRCPADETTEIQLVKSTVLRQTMDNIYTVNNNTRYVSNKVNLDDLLDNQIAGIVRVDGDVVSNHVMPAPITPIGDVTMPMIEYFDTAKENRTGFTRYNSGMDANSLNKTATGVRIISEAGNERIALMSRCFAEQGLKNLMIGVHGLCQRHGMEKQTLRLRGQWVTVDPREWKTRYDMTVSVGLGNADKQLQMQAAQMLLQTQKEISGVPGLVMPNNVYQAAVMLAKALGEKNATKYFSQPAEGMPPPPDPTQDPMFKIKVAELHLKGRDADNLEAKMQAEEQARQDEMQFRAAELSLREREIRVKEDTAQAIAANDAGMLELKAQLQGFQTQNQFVQTLGALQQQLHDMQIAHGQLTASVQDQLHRQKMDIVKTVADTKPKKVRIKKQADGSYQAVSDDPAAPKYVRITKEPDGSFVAASGDQGT